MITNAAKLCVHANPGQSPNLDICLVKMHVIKSHLQGCLFHFCGSLQCCIFEVVRAFALNVVGLNVFFFMIVEMGLWSECTITYLPYVN